MAEENKEKKTNKGKSTNEGKPTVKRKYTAKKVVPSQKKTESKKTPESQNAGPSIPNKLKPYLFIAVAIVFILVFFIPEDTPVVLFTKKPLMGLLGNVAYFIPLYFIVFAVFLNKYSENSNIKNEKIWTLAINIVSLTILLHLLTSSEYVFSPIKLWKAGVEREGSGVIGGLFGTAIAKFMTPFISYTVFGFLFLITLLFLFGRSPKLVWLAIYKKYLVPLGRKLKKLPSKICEAIKARKANGTDESEAETEIAADEHTEYEPEYVAAIEAVSEPSEERDRSCADEHTNDSQKGTETEETAEAETSKEIEITKETVPLGNNQPPKYTFPPISLLKRGDSGVMSISPEMIKRTADKLVDILAAYNVRAKVVSTSIGPTVTRYELEPELGVRVNTIARLTDDIALHLAAESIRIEAPIPGMSAVGIEIPNPKKRMVCLRDMIEAPEFKKSKSKLCICLGLDVAGNSVYFDIDAAPHLLIAGATGMGKSVCINSLIVSLLYRATPDEVKFILIDPKKVEFSCYEGIPHLLVPVVTLPKKAARTLNWAVMEMERRFELLNEVNARNLSEYNEIISGDEEKEKLPAIVIIIDELADLMMAASSDVETAICRLAAKARAAGMHLIVGTQRPSVDVITGLIKANMPSRIAFTVVSQVDSRIILDSAGAEKLLGRGDMLFSPVGQLKQTRIQGAFIDGNTEVTEVCEFIKQAAAANYNESVIQLIEEQTLNCGAKKKKGKEDEDEEDSGDVGKVDSDIIKALEIAFEDGTLSTSLLQRRLAMGYARAARTVDKLERCGYIGKLDPSTKKRPILISSEEFLELKANFDTDTGEE